MEDPDPSNIYGEKRTVHTVDHIIRWDYALLAVAGLYVAYKLFGGMSSTSTNSNELDEVTGGFGPQDAAEIIVE